MYSIIYQDPNNRIEGKEGRSKLIAKNSPLYLTLKLIRDDFRKQNLSESKIRMDFHTELLIKTEDRNNKKLLVQRCQLIHNRDIDIYNTENWTTIGKALVIKTGHVQGYGKTHITVAFFPNGVPKNWLETVKKYL